MGINLISFFLFYKLFIDKMKSDGREMQDAAPGGYVKQRPTAVISPRKCA